MLSFIGRPPPIKGGEYLDHYVDLTHRIVEGCTFDGCILELWRRPPFAVVRDCEITNCALVGDAWPADAFLPGRRTIGPT